MTDAQAKEATMVIFVHWKWKAVSQNWKVDPRIQRLTFNGDDLVIPENGELNSRGRRRLLQSLARLGS